MKYEELYEKYQELLEENMRLKAENEDFKNQLGLVLPVFNSEIHITPKEEGEPLDQYNCSGQINNCSSPQDKINLFMSLFKGRGDVYAKRWQNKEGRTGYSPVCLNEWEKGICGKPKVKCSSCVNKDYAILDVSAIESHLRGKAIFGIYPMLPDETCYFLAMDFDDDGWQIDINALRNICTEKNIPFAVERSQSGNGAHVWFFFKEQISAVKARKFGTLLLTHAMSIRHEIKFNSYDRLFPNQDTLPKGGLGNLIALPLQSNSRKNNNSVMVDEDFKPYNDQWQFLSRIRKMDETDIDGYISQLGYSNELGDLRQIDNEEEIKPWEKNRIDVMVSENDIPDAINIIKANMLYIYKEGFSNKALNIMKRLAAFRNPDFYKAQAMRLPTFNKPRIISLSDETMDYLCLPRGCDMDLVKLFEHLKTDIKWIDETFSGKSIKVKFNGQLRDEQADAVSQMLNYNNGVLSATTAFGKTVIGARLIYERKVNTLVLVHTQQLLEQWKDRLSQFLTIGEELPDEPVKKRGRKKIRSIIGQLGGGKKNLSGIIDIAVMQSLVKGDEVKDAVHDYGMVIVDECHHVPAFSFEQILKNVSAKYVYGLTATPVRQDGHHPIIFMHCGPVRYKVDAKEQAKKRPFEHYIIPRFTPFRKPVSQDEKEWSIGEIYSEISTSQIRNRLIIDDVIKCVKEGRNPIILTERTAHVEFIAEELSKTIPNVIELTGGMTAKERKNKIEKLLNIPPDDNIVIVATGRFVGEGFDEPRLDTLFLAMPVAWKGTVQQYAGRLHRLYQKKSEVQIYDYVDVHVGVLERMYQKRLKGYAAIGYSAKSDSKLFEDTNAIFDNHNFMTIFSNDILSSKSDIVIVSPYMTKKRLSQMLNILSYGINNGAKLTIITRPESDYKGKNREKFSDMINTIKLTGSNLIFKSNIHQKFAVIDQRIVWYGSINFLSFGSSEESIMRLDSVNIANELIGTVI
ncbi:TOTE conflict system archaeo-eukaryotic primase domain-containing protein [Sedimentibacter sp.]|uniref:TOTE conflict system archaeo-eukaryotic primase domain-containing protein n=1 Tax=Sedimentibacter sp. TaxID=1960295 RepID=UPI0028985C54|nr:DEAD/DEAH box helicase family protein [Sedimentibacter sp.]